MRGILRFPLLAIIAALILVVITLMPLSRLGSEFMPPLDEGDLLYMPITMPGISITEVKNVLQQTDRIIRTFPEVEYVFGKAGRAETATDPAPLSMIGDHHPPQGPEILASGPDHGKAHPGNGGRG